VILNDDKLAHEARQKEKADEEAKRAKMIEEARQLSSKASSTE